MLSHERIWEVIDALAARHGLSVSALARRAGLDPTTFNRSKRIGLDGRLRWPSTESISKILDATGTDLAAFYDLLGGANGKSGRALLGAVAIPPLRYGRQTGPGFAEAGAAGEDEAASTLFPADPDCPTYLVPVTTPLFGGLYRPGDRLVVTPAEDPRPGDRLLAFLVDGRCSVVEAAFDGTLRSAPDEASSEAERAIMPRSAVALLTRILWVSQ